MDKTVDTAKVYKCTKFNNRRNGTFKFHTRFKLSKNLRTLGFACSFQYNTTRKNYVITVTIHLDNTSLNASSHVSAQIFNTTEVYKRSRQESTKTDIKDKTTLNNLDNFTFNINASFKLLFNGIPSTLVLGTFLRKNKTTFFVFFLKNQSLDGVTHMYKLFWACIFTNRQLTGWNYAFGLKADVQQYLIVLNFNNGTCYQVSLIKIGDGSIDKAIKLIIGNII